MYILIVIAIYLFMTLAFGTSNPEEMFTILKMMGFQLLRKLFNKWISYCLILKWDCLSIPKLIAKICLLISRVPKSYALLRNLIIVGSLTNIVIPCPKKLHDKVITHIFLINQLYDKCMQYCLIFRLLFSLHDELEHFIRLKLLP